MLKYKTVILVGVMWGVIFFSSPLDAFHGDIYIPRAPESTLETLQDIDNPFIPTLENLKEGGRIYFGKGLCVTCHGKNGKGVEVPGHPPRNFTDSKWQSIRTDGEMMWVLKNGSPGTSMPIRVGKVISEDEGWKVILFIRKFAS
jgi:cytochrome c